MVLFSFSFGFVFRPWFFAKNWDFPIQLTFSMDLTLAPCLMIFRLRQSLALAMSSVWCSVSIRSESKVYYKISVFCVLKIVASNWSGNI